jgi:tetratricopeptide (TPR) repeat protein
MVTVDVRQGKLADARARAEAALARQPSSAALHLMVGGVQTQMKDYAAAEKSYRRAIELDAANLAAYGLLGQMYHAQGRIDQAIAEFERVVARSPRPAAVHTLIGILLESQNRVDEARKRYEAALAAEPGSPVAANNLAWLMAENGGNLDVALELAQTARAKLPDSAEVADTLGWIYYKKGLFGQAVAVLKETVASQPNVAASHYHLGLSFARSGDASLARSTLQTALKLDPAAPMASEARAELSRMGG